MSTAWAIIPARGGSKGIPRKNLQIVNGHPLLAWSIAAAKASKSVSRIIISTDSEEIATVAKSYGAEVPFMRPAALAADASRDIEFLQHAVHWFEEYEHVLPDFWLQLRPTSPLRTAALLNDAVKKLCENPGADSLRVVTTAPLTPYKMWVLTENNQLSPLLTLENVAEPFNEPRQTLPKIYWQIGTLDVICTATLKEQHSVSGKNILGLEVPANWALDIDNLQDLERAGHALTQVPFNELVGFLSER